MARTVSDAKEFGPFDYIVVTLKALPDMYDTADIISPAVAEGKSTIVLIQNGFGKLSALFSPFFFGIFATRPNKPNLFLTYY